MLVIDASAAVDIVLRSPKSQTLKLLTQNEHLLAPHVMYSESLSAVGRLERAGKIAASDAEAAVGWLTRLPVRTVWTPDWIADAWAKRSWLRTTDAVYVAAAERLGTPLLTTDQRLARALRDRSIQVISV